VPALLATPPLVWLPPRPFEPAVVAEPPLDAPALGFEPVVAPSSQPSDSAHTEAASRQPETEDSRGIVPQR
jgi:hypothetical protein